MTLQTCTIRHPPRRSHNHISLRAASPSYFRHSATAVAPWPYRRSRHLAACIPLRHRRFHPYGRWRACVTLPPHYLDKSPQIVRIRGSPRRRAAALPPSRRISRYLTTPPPSQCSCSWQLPQSLRRAPPSRLAGSPPRRRRRAAPLPLNLRREISSGYTANCPPPCAMPPRQLQTAPPLVIATHYRGVELS